MFTYRQYQHCLRQRVQVPWIDMGQEVDVEGAHWEDQGQLQEDGRDASLCIIKRVGCRPTHIVAYVQTVR